MQSVTGETWSEVGALPAGAEAILDGPKGILVGGLVQLHQSVQVAVWSSTTGSTWTSFADEPAFSSRDCASENPRGPDIGAFTMLGGAVVALGTAVWRSDDGMTWKCLGSSPNLNIVGGHDVLIGAATDRKSDPSLWISSDGAEWTKTQSLAAGVEVAPVATGFVAVPVWQGALNAVYTSADGLRWTGQPNPFRQTPMAQIASDGTRAVLLEEFEGPGGQSPGGVWVSSGDGASWTRYQLPILEGERPYSAAILGSHVVVSGQYDPPDQSPSEQVLWTADLPG